MGTMGYENLFAQIIISFIFFMKKVLCVVALVLVGGCFALSFTFDGRIAGAKYLAELGFIQKREKDADYNATSYITRAELTGIALKFAGHKISEPFTCKKYFADVTQDDWICATVEKAADVGLISRNNKNFNPQSNITRPEAVALILKSSSLDNKIPADLSSFEHPRIAFVPDGGTIETWLNKRQDKGYDVKIVLVNPADWRFSIFQKALYAGIIDEKWTMIETGKRKSNYQKYKYYYDNIRIASFWEDFFIFRGDAFIIF